MIHRNVIEVLKMLLGCKDLEPYFTLKYSPEFDSQGNRVYAKPCGSRDFENYSVGFKELLFNTFSRYPNIENKVPLAMMLYTDSTNLTQLANGQKAWPVYLNLENVERRVRQSQQGANPPHWILSFPRRKRERQSNNQIISLTSCRKRKGFAE